MFVSHDKNPSKKKFQKPNILRRKAIVNKTSLVKNKKANDYGSSSVKSLLNTSFDLDPKDKEIELENVSRYQNNCTVSGPVRLKTDNSAHLNNTVGETSLQNNVTLNVNDDEVPLTQSINVESFLLSDVVKQNIPLFNANISQNKDGNQQQKWCLDINRESQKIVIEHFDSSQMSGLYQEQKSDVMSMMVPLSAVSSIQEPQVVYNTTTAPANVQQISIEELTQAPIRFKCDVSDCSKEFMSEQKLNKHKNTHNKDGAKVPRQITVGCPVKKIQDGGVEEACGRIFHVREDLIKHLNEEHTIEEAVHRCPECGRRFFWASGLRAHVRAHSVRAGRAVLACPWPGCTRVFRQPCRLREHARAHTGDKPYPCDYPNCGWSFRTASKLVRHARRHTGERRHVCGACGRAFLRREHLRDHAARHHAPQARRTHACPHADCQQSFTNMSSLYIHMKKVHKKDESDTPQVVQTVENEETQNVETENLFMVSLLEPSETNSTEEQVPVEEGHSARTHCTWPLPPRTEYNDAYVLEDVQVEQSEASESNIYTVRSDLFLHGNLLHNEDSEQMSTCVHVSECQGEGDGGERAADGLSLDADLLLDAPSVHLDQEELYTDAVDESPFRVFFLSGEELV
ncbi:putative zinc finger protein [Danaus plexippus plexippus]|uniref:Zinc finger protein n=1 Tax=Danaus plexippus plexippus TaxID=278856 RepID=A0A212EPX2_DANPL|nr:putative zinc finger protein [Danaus plexippus plexippus]